MSVQVVELVWSYLKVVFHNSLFAFAQFCSPIFAYNIVFHLVGFISKIVDSDYFVILAINFSFNISAA